MSCAKKTAAQQTVQRLMEVDSGELKNNVFKGEKVSVPDAFETSSDRICSVTRAVTIRRPRRMSGRRSVHTSVRRQLAQAFGELESLYRVVTEQQGMLQIEALGLWAFQ